MGFDAVGLELTSADNGPLNDLQECMDQLGKHIIHFRLSTLSLLIR